MTVWRWLCAAVAIGCCLSSASAQESPAPQSFRLVALSARSIEADPGSTISIAFSVQSHSPASLRLIPSVVMPDGWSVITGFDAFSLAPLRTETWIMSLFVPTRAESATYFLQIGANIPGHDSADRRSETIRVDIRRKRGLTVALVKRPEYVISGTSYELGFRVKNRGNGSAEIRLAAQSILDSTATVDAPVLHLRAEGDTTVTVRIKTSTAGEQRSDDVVQLSAAERIAGVDSAPVFASAHVTVVQTPGSNEPLATIPTTVGVRAASAKAGVSPFEIVGRGKLRPDREEIVDFVFHGKSGLNSPFGDERDNRFEIRTSGYRARIGDNVFMSSTLTGMGQIGLGAGVELNRGLFSGGAYSQRFRYTPGNQSERALNFAVNPVGFLSGYRVSFNGVDRSGGPFAGRVFSSGLRLSMMNETLVDAELATSTGNAGRGYANSVRLMGGRSFRYDFGHVAGDSIYAGPTRNAQNDYADFSLPATSTLRLNATVNRSRFASGSDSTLPRQEFGGVTVSAVYADRLSVEYSGVGRTIGGNRWHLAETQRFGKARIDQPSPFGNSWLALEMGERGDSASNGRTYHLLQLGTSVNASISSFSIYTELYDGGSLTRGLPGMSTFGGNASLRLTESSTLSVFGYTARHHIAAARSYSQIDTRLTHVLANGSRLSVRLRSATTSLGAPTEKIGYVEYSLPIGLPTGRIPRPGRATGTVTDGESGRALAGVLVRLGPQAGVTDQHGRVTFAGLAPGEYRASLASEVSISNAAYVGNPVVKIDTAREAKAFQLAVLRAARIHGTVRQFSSVRTAIGAEADSLEYNGPVAGVTIALAGVSDTLYRITDADGQFTFDEIAGGQWTLFVESDVPPGFLIEHPRVAVSTTPGKQVLVDFRVIPKRKRVKFIAGLPERDNRTGSTQQPAASSK